MQEVRHVCDRCVRLLCVDCHDHHAGTNQCPFKTTTHEFSALVIYPKHIRNSLLKWPQFNQGAPKFKWVTGRAPSLRKARLEAIRLAIEYMNAGRDTPLLITKKDFEVPALLEGHHKNRATNRRKP